MKKYLKKKLSSFLLLISVFVFIYSPVMKIGSLIFVTFKLFPLVLFFLSVVFLKKIPKAFLLILNTLLFVLVFLVIHYQLSLYKDSTFIERVGIGFLILIGSFFFVHTFKSLFADRALSKLIDYIILSGVFNAVIMILQLFSDSFREFTNLFFENTIFETNIGEIQRLNGVASSGGAVLSVIMALSLVLIHFKLVKLGDRNWSAFKLVIIIICLLFGIVYSGRSGLVLLFFYFIYHFFTSFEIKMLIKYAMYAVVGVMLSLYVLDTYSDTSEYLSALRRTSEIFIRLRDEGQLSTTSTDLIQNMYYLPEDQLTLLIGNGNFGRRDNLPYVESDVFYIRVIFGVGVVGLLVFITPIIVMFLVTLNGNGYLRGFLNLVLSVMVILNFKEVFYFGTPGFTAQVGLLLAFHLSPDRLIRKEIFNGL